MEILHYYATDQDQDFGPHLAEQCELLANSMLDQDMVRRIISTQATGSPPYTLYVPRLMIYNAHRWDMPPALLRIIPIDGKPETNPDVCDTADLNFGTLVCIIHARRCLPQMEFVACPLEC